MRVLFCNQMLKKYIFREYFIPTSYISCWNLDSLRLSRLFVIFATFWQIILDSYYNFHPVLIINLTHLFLERPNIQLN